MAVPTNEATLTESHYSLPTPTLVPLIAEPTAIPESSHNGISRAALYGIMSGSIVTVLLTIAFAVLAIRRHRRGHALFAPLGKHDRGEGGASVNCVEWRAEDARPDLSLLQTRTSRENVHRSISVRSVMTLPAYRNRASDTQFLLTPDVQGDENDDDIGYPIEILPDEDALREEEMEALYQIRVARRRAISKREELRRMRREFRERDDSVGLEELRCKARDPTHSGHASKALADLRNEHPELQAKKGSISTKPSPITIEHNSSEGTIASHLGKYDNIVVVYCSRDFGSDIAKQTAEYRELPQPIRPVAILDSAPSWEDPDSTTIRPSELTPAPSSTADSDIDDSTTLESDSMSSVVPSASSIIPHSLEVSKRRAVDTLMAEFRSLLNHGWLSGVKVRGGAGTPSVSHSQGISSSSSSAEVGGSAKRERRDSIGSNASDSFRRGGNPKRPKQEPPSGVTVSRKLACPFYKHNPKKHLKLRSCGGPGWDSTHRVKEHIYRNHKLPTHCNRCGSLMPTSADLFKHQRQAVACEVQLVNWPEGIDESQEKALRKRLRASSEEEKWVEIYKILFPDEDGDLVPSPYYDEGQPKAEDLVLQYERVQRRELLRVVRKKLEEEVLGIVGPMEDTLRTQFMGIVRDAQMEVFRSYRGTHVESMTPVSPTSDESSRDSLDDLVHGEAQAKPLLNPLRSFPNENGFPSLIIANRDYSGLKNTESAHNIMDFDAANLRFDLPAMLPQPGVLEYDYENDLGTIAFDGITTDAADQSLQDRNLLWLFNNTHHPPVDDF